MDENEESKMTLRVLVGAPGSGKSHRLRQEAEERGGRYVFAYPSIALLKEQAEEFKKSDRFRIIEAHSESAGHGKVSDKLEKSVRDAMSQDWEDVVVMTTHESLMSCNVAIFIGWHFCIDEAPTAIQAGSISSEISSDFYRTHFKLDPIEGQEWHKVSRRDPTSRWSEILRDDAARHAAEFFKCASRDGSTFVNISNWGNKRFQWCSIWSPEALKGIAQTVTISGASYLESLGARIALLSCDVKTVNIDTLRLAFPRVRINYFTQGHRGSSSFWSSSEGRKRIVKVCDYLSKIKIGYWSGNDNVKILMEHRVSGKMISSKSSGLNNYDECNSCAIIYSSKATPSDAALKEGLFFTENEILRAREQEDIFQFIFRGAIRRRDFGEDYNVYLYSYDQADNLKAMLEKHGFNDVELVPITEVDMIDDKGPSEGKRKPSKEQKVISERTGKAIKASSEERAKRRNKQSQDVPPKKRGRPRKSQ